MLNNIFKSKTFGYVMRAAIISATIFFSASVLHSHAQDAAKTAEPANVTLYGQKITIDTSEVDLPGEPYQWRDTAYLIPKVLPGILEGKDQRTLKQVLETLGKWSNLYQYELYTCSLYNLAVDMENKGMVDAAYIYRNEKGGYVKGEVPERVRSGTRQEKIDVIYGAIGLWVAENRVNEYVEAYNKARGEQVLSPLAFKIPTDMYAYSRALFNLDVVVRNSPEVKQADLVTYGAVRAHTPECMQDLGPYSNEPMFPLSDNE